MRFWDTSAVLPLLIGEDATKSAQTLYRADPTMVVAWTTVIECGSAIARAEHEGLLDTKGATVALARLDELATRWREVEPSNDLREICRRLLRAHRLRASDAVQLASATIASERRPESLTFFALDQRLVSAAMKEGFKVIEPS